MSRWLNNHGDTLVEVLMSIAVLSSVIGISYSIAGRAQRNSLIAQEHSEATSVARTQVERLRTLRDGGNFSPDTFDAFFAASYGNPGTAFCIKDPVVFPATPATTLTDANIATNCKLGTVNRYKVKVTFQPSSPTSPKLFEVNVDWEAPGSVPAQHLAVEYRLW